MPLYTSDALILRTYKLGESDRIVVFLTRDRGKKRGVAKNARQSRRRFGGALEPMTIGRVGYLERERRALPQARVFVALGALAFEGCLKILAQAGEPVPRPKPRFAHGGSWRIGTVQVFATYHPSQQNTFTGRLTSEMLAAVFRRARAAAGAEG